MDVTFYMLVPAVLLLSFTTQLFFCMHLLTKEYFFKKNECFVVWIGFHCVVCAAFIMFFHRSFIFFNKQTSSCVWTVHAHLIIAGFLASAGGSVSLVGEPAPLPPLTMATKAESVASVTSQCSFSSTIVHVGDKKPPESGGNHQHRHRSNGGK